jgi:hypothetical protein
LGARSVRGKVGGELKGGKLMKLTLKALEHDGSLSRAESHELQSLLEHRNKIAHEIHLLTGDIDVPGRGYQFSGLPGIAYDYTALNKMRKWQKSIYDRIPISGAVSLSMNGMLFEAAEQAYELTLSTLRKRIDRQRSIRRNRIEEARRRSKERARDSSKR